MLAYTPSLRSTRHGDGPNSYVTILLTFLQTISGNQKVLRGHMTLFGCRMGETGVTWPIVLDRTVNNKIDTSHLRSVGTVQYIITNYR